LRLPLSGSAALAPDIARVFAGRFGVRILQGYGVTEIGVISLNRHASEPVRFDSVGPALAGVEWRLEETDELGVGELLVRSPGLASDAEGRFESGRLTADGWLRTGDLVRVDADGYLYVLGRRGAVLNVNGAKADPGEIERVIESLPWVAECAVKGMLDERGAERIVAFVVPRPGAEVRFPAEEVQRCVAESLSLFKVPGRVHVMDALPRTSLGKVAYAALEPPPPRPAPAGPPLAPRSAVERDVAALWCEVLGLPRVSVRDGFTSLGGTSVQLAELLARLRERFGCDLTLVDLFRFPTVESQARAVARVGSDDLLGALDAARAQARRQRDELLRRQGSRGGPAPAP
jgi:acyl carrier protein